jgi:hypothetical protein
VVFLGSTAVGAPLVGWLAEVAGPRAGLALGGAAAIGAAAYGQIAFSRSGAAVADADYAAAEASECATTVRSRPAALAS